MASRARRPWFGGVEVAADAAPAGERALGVPVPGDGLVPFRAFDGPLGAVAGPLDGELAGEQPDLLLVRLQPAASSPGRSRGGSRRASPAAGYG